MPQAKPTNPFYALLLVAGVVFAITACAYCVMTVRGLEPRADEVGIMRVLSEHGLTILVVELVALGILTFAAIGTDDYWTRAGGRESGVGSQGSGVVDREGEAADGESEVGGQRSEVGGNKP